MPSVAVERPRYLNLFKIHLPVTGVVSLAHRASGVVLFLAIPFSVWLLERSLSGPQGFDQVLALLQQPLMKLMTLVVLWSLAHHFFAGIRFLLIDVDVGVDKQASRRAAWLVLVVEALVVLASLGALL